jgi:hypothetical protein
MDNKTFGGCAKCGHLASGHTHRGCTEPGCKCVGGFTWKLPQLSRAAQHEAIREAARLLLSVADDMDDRQERCECCGVVKRKNWHESQIKLGLGAILTKLGRLEGRLDAPPTEADEMSEEVEP